VLFACCPALHPVPAPACSVDITPEVKLPEVAAILEVGYPGFLGAQVST
jgi:hypothetical protein